MASAIQRSFAAGEIAPALYGRADLIKYATGLRTCRNFFVQRHGGASNRAGFGYVVEVKDSSKRVRAARFVFNSLQTYVLEFGDGYMRVIKNGAQVKVSGVAAYNGATAYVVGDLVVQGGVNYYCIKDTTGNAPPNATYWYALTGDIYEIPTPYAEAHLQELKFVQANDIVTITHQSYEPRELQRAGDTIWGLSVISFKPQTAAPTGVNVSGSAGTEPLEYVVCAVDNDTFEESLPGEISGAPATITNIVKITTKKKLGVPSKQKARVTAAGHGLSDGQEVLFASVVGMTQINGQQKRVSVIDANTFDVRDLNVVNFSAYSSGGTATPTSKKVTLAAPASGTPVTVSWTAVDGVREYNIYKVLNGIFGFIGVASGTSFVDKGLTPDTSLTPPIDRVPFNGPEERPATSGYFQQRQVFAATALEPYKVWASRVSSFRNLANRSPLIEDDAVVFSIASLQVNEVRHIIDLGKMVLLTSEGEYVVQGDANGVLTPFGVNLKQQGYNGASKVPPLVITNSALYVQARGSIVRDLRYEFAVDGYTGRDLTLFSPHLVDGFQITDWAYQQVPHSVVWARRDDGTLMSLTYLRDHDIAGWGRHDTDGEFENVVVVPEGEEDVLYAVIKRTINGATKRYFERMASRFVTDVTTDCRFMDSFLTYDGRSQAGTLTITGGTNWTYDEELTATLAGAGITLDATYLGDAFFYKHTDGVTYKFTIASVSSGTVAKVNCNKTVPVAMRGAALSGWQMGRRKMTAAHLEGKTLAVVADGNVVSNGTGTPLYTVTAGTITIPNPAVVVHFGLPIVADLETLDLEDPAGETMSDKKKLIQRVNVFVESSRGFWAGQDADHLIEYKQRASENMGEPIALTTGVLGPVLVKATWNTHGRTFIRQKDPLPLTVLAVVPAGIVST